jgi:hypothetical protein
VSEFGYYCKTCGHQFDDSPLFAMLLTCPNCAEIEKAEKAAQLERDKAASVAARERWQQLRQRHAGSPELSAVLDLHRPNDHAVAECGHCEESDGMEATQNVRWPCPTFQAIDRDQGDDGAVPEGAPDTPQPGNVTIHIHGSVTDERRLADVVEAQMLRKGARRATAYQPYSR